MPKTLLQVVMSAKGIDDCLKKLIKYDQKICTDALRRALRVGAKIVLERAKSDIPQVTGDTVRSLKVRAGKANRKKRLIQYRCITTGEQDAFYFNFVEWGTKFIQARHYMKEATKEVESQVISLVRSQLRSSI